MKAENPAVIPEGKLATMIVDSVEVNYDPEKLDEPDKVKHSHVGKYYLREKLHINDKDILNAVYNHTVLRSNDKLSLITYVADKREPNRGINDEVVAIARKDLKKAVETLINKWKEKHEYKDDALKAYLKDNDND